MNTSWGHLLLGQISFGKVEKEVEYPGIDRFKLFMHTYHRTIFRCPGLKTIALIDLNETGYRELGDNCDLTE